MSKIAVLITNMFEDSEYTEPARALTDAGHRLTHIGLNAGETVTGKREGTEVAVDTTAEGLHPGQFDAMLIPGGYSPDKLRVDDDIVAFTREFVNAGKPVFAICHGPQLLITAQVLDGRTLTGYRSIRQDIINAGGEYVDQEVVVHANLVTSRHPGDLPAFVKTILRKLDSA